MDRKVWRATVHRVTKNQTRPKRFSTHTYAQLIDNVLLVSGVHKVVQLSIYMYSFFFKFFAHLGYYRMLSIVPCAIQ